MIALLLACIDDRAEPAVRLTLPADTADDSAYDTGQPYVEPSHSPPLRWRYRGDGTCVAHEVIGYDLGGYARQEIRICRRYWDVSPWCQGHAVARGRGNWMSFRCPLLLDDDLQGGFSAWTDP